MKRMLLCLLMLVVCGCGGGAGSVQPVAVATSYVGTWGYDDSTTKIRYNVTSADSTGYTGTVQVTWYNADGSAPKVIVADVWGGIRSLSTTVTQETGFASTSNFNAGLVFRVPYSMIDCELPTDRSLVANSALAAYPLTRMQP
jgi:hypothetical protein